MNKVTGTCVVCGGKTIKLPLSEYEAEAMFRNEPIFRNLVERLARRLMDTRRVFTKYDMMAFADYCMQAVDSGFRGDEKDLFWNEWERERNSK